MRRMTTIVAGVTAILLIALAGSSIPAAARSAPLPLQVVQRSAPGQGSTTPCVNDAKDVCLAANPVDVNLGGCPLPQWFDNADAFGVAQTWTLSNGHSACISVRYLPTPRSGCRFLFYVPAGNASAVIFFGWNDAAGHHGQTSPHELNEAPISGWYYINDNSGQPIGTNSAVTAIDFADNNGQSATSIGWGRNPDHGIWETC